MLYTNNLIFQCSRAGCNIKFTRAPNQVRKVNQIYCSSSCAAKVNNVLYPKRKAAISVCGYCKRKFKSSGIYCSRKCKDKAGIIPNEKITAWIIRFNNKFGRIPLKREYTHYHAARGRFGTWNNAIIAAGFEPNPVMFSRKYIAKDGHKCDSLAERIIDDFLSRRNIPHIRNIPYPGLKGYTADFKVGDYWIEFFGLYGELKGYDEIHNDKIKIAKDNNLKLIKIYPYHLYPKGRLEEKLSFQLKHRP